MNSRKILIGNGNSNCQNQPSNNSSNNIVQKDSNSLLKDLIKILVIKELIAKSNVRRFPYTYGGTISPYFMNNQNMPYMVN